MSIHTWPTDEDQSEWRINQRSDRQTNEVGLACYRRRPLERECRQVMKPPGLRSRERPNTRWTDYVDRNLKLVVLKIKMADGRRRWRR